MIQDCSSHNEYSCSLHITTMLLVCSFAAQLMMCRVSDIVEHRSNVSLFF